MKDYRVEVVRPGKRIENPNEKGQFLWRYAVRTAYGILFVTAPGSNEPPESMIVDIARKAIDERPTP